MLRVVAKPTDQSQDSPREVSESSRRALAYVAVLVIVVIGLNARAISDLATRLTPKLPTVTNLLDLISFVLITLKLFTVGVRNNLLRAYIQTLQGYTFGNPFSPQYYHVHNRGLFLLCTFSLFPLFLLYLNDINYSKLLEIISRLPSFLLVHI
jgi:hypothetical protein